MMNKFAVAAVISLAALVGSTANAGQACMTVGGSFTGSCKDIQVTGPGCAGNSSTTMWYGYEVRAACRNYRGEWTQAGPYPISTNISSGGGIPKIQTQTCRELGNDNGRIYCTKK